MKTLVCGLAIALSLSAVQWSHAATTVNATSFDAAGDPSSRDLIEVLRSAYGYTAGDGGTAVGTDPQATAAVASSFTFGSGLGSSITFTRVTDGGTAVSPENINTQSGGGDNFWTLSGTGLYRVEAKFSGTDPIVFGWTSDNGATLNSIVTVNNSSSYPGSLQPFSATSSAFQFYITGVSTAGNFEYFSNPTSGGPSTNGGEDHMVTFLVDGFDKKSLTNVHGFVVAWEDLPFIVSDKDYQDAVFQVSSSTGVTGTPLPAAVWGGASLFGMLGGSRLLRRRKS